MSPTVPEAWKPRLKRYLRERSGEDRDDLSASDFPPNQSVHLRFTDGSHALFRFAFAIADDSAGEIAVFTEHCGYHIFPAGGVELETFHSVWE